MTHTSQPLVGVILLNWNGFEVTKECIWSLQKVSYSPIRIFVVDNASTNNEASRLSDLFGSKIHVIRNAENLGFAAGNNIGMQYAIADGCEAILFLNNDTIVDKNFLSPLVNHIRADKTVGMVGPKIYRHHTDKRIWFAGGTLKKYSGMRMYHTGLNKTDRGQFNKTTETDFLTGCCILIPTRIAKTIGPLPEEYFLYFEDVDWSLTAHKAGYKLIFEPKSIIWHKEVSEKNELSPQKTYYLTRNYLIFAMKHGNFFQRIFFVLFFCVYELSLIIRNAFTGKHEHNAMIIHGIRDYLTHRTGKRELNNFL